MVNMNLILVKKYLGEWANDKRNGKGTNLWVNVKKYVGEWEEDSSHSLFTKYFLKAISGEGDSNKDGKVNDNELKEYLSDTMTYYARRYYGRDQKAQIHNGG